MNDLDVHSRPQGDRKARTDAVIVLKSCVKQLRCSWWLIMYGRWLWRSSLWWIWIVWGFSLLRFRWVELVIGTYIFYSANSWHQQDFSIIPFLCEHLLFLIIHISDIFTNGMSCVYLRERLYCLAKTVENIGNYALTFLPKSFICAMLKGTIDYLHFLPCSVTLTWSVESSTC